MPLSPLLTTMAWIAVIPPFPSPSPRALSVPLPGRPRQRRGGVFPHEHQVLEFPAPAAVLAV